MSATRVCVHGLGYIGLPTAAVLAGAGARVFGVDSSARVRAAVAAGRTHIEEPGLEALLAAARHSGALSVHAAPCAAEFHLIAVPTPLDAERRPVLDHVWAAADALAPVLRAGDCVILESTVPVGTTAALAARLPALPLDIAHCPERVLPGRILEELAANERLVGGLTPAASARAAGLYRRFVRGAIHLTDAATAEMAKLAENAFRDVNIAFANTLSLLAARHGLDAREVIRLANRHPRVAILNPGPGVGGHCLAVDPWFLADGAGEDAALLRAARHANERKTEWVLARLAELAQAQPGAPVTCFGLAYKAEVGDLRESPALAIARALTVRFGARVAATDPHVAEAEGVALIPLEAARARPGLWAMLVGHDAFRGLDRAGRTVFDALG